ncbi:MAG: DUF6785 family protein [Armatimonadota bacterium]
MPDLAKGPDGISRRPLTTRAVVIGVIGAAVSCWMISWAEMTVGSMQIGILQFTPVAIGLLLAVVLANLLIGSLAPRFALKPHEIVIIYAMTLTAALTMSRGLLERWIPALIGVNYYATEANHWQSLFIEHIPQWAVPFDVEGDPAQWIARSFYEGLRAGSVPWGPWLRALAAWLPVVIAMFVAYFCLASILRRQWVDNERLAFPLTVLPIELSEHFSWRNSIFADPIMWIGFAIPTLIFITNGIHEMRPSIPEIPVRHNLNQLVFNSLGRPWRDLGNTTASFSMGGIGFGYFLPSQVLFSLWAFFVLHRLQNIAFSAFGASREAMPLFPTTIWNGYQVAGAYLVLVGSMARAAIPHLRRVWRAALTHRETTAEHEAEAARSALPPRLALIGLGAAVVVATWWFTLLGMSWWMAVLETLIFLLVVCVVMARAVAEAGLPMTETSFRPVDLVRLFSPMRALTPQTLTALSLADAVFTRDLRGNLLSTFLDALKMSDATQLDRRHLFVALSIALLVVLTFGVWLHIVTPYEHGAIGMYSYVYRSNPILGFRYFQPVLQTGDDYDLRLPIFFASGVLVTLAMSVMRMRYVWWPLSPLGVALSGSWSMIVFWFPMLLAWLVKSTIVRYGGMRLYQRLRPLFFGLILGEFSQAVIWATISAIWRIPAPRFPW